MTHHFGGAAFKSRSAPQRIKLASLADDGTFEGYGSVFNVVDSGGDVILPGAFAESLARLAQDGTRAKLLWQHCHDEPIGSWLEMKEDGHGLWCRGRLLLDIQKARECYALMKAGELDGLSIGYECLEWENARPEDLGVKFGVMPMGGYYGTMPGHVRVLKTIDLWEVSVVTFPMNEAARVEAVKTAPRTVDLSSVLTALDRRERMFSGVAG